jgi:hypothetical protein
MLEEKVFNIINAGIFNMAEFLTDGLPAIGMNSVCKFSHLKPNIAIWFVDVMFFEFFAYYFSLYIKAFFAESQ